jgi:transposase-like protein
MAMLCVRNAHLETIHAGKTPVTKIGDWSDVTVVDAEGTLRRAGQDDDLAYSAERKAAVLTKMLPPNNMPLRRLSQEEGISQATLAKWRAEARTKGQLLPDANAGPEGWTSRDKLAAVIETAPMNAADLGEYCRRRGVYPEQLRVWREACERAND